MKPLFGSYRAVAFKELVAVDLPDAGSNQHEINGVTVLKEFFGTSETLKGEIFWHSYFDNEEPQHDHGEFTFYDSREKHPTRSEWRLYYQGDFLSRADPGDILILTRDLNNQVNGLLFQKDSGWLRAAKKFFDISIDQPSFRTISNKDMESIEFDIKRKWMAQELQLELPQESVISDEELVVEKFGYEFPTSRSMSRFAREQAAKYVANPDKALLSWLEREEELFLALENAVVQPRLDRGFSDVDDFISYSLTVQNRRKSRMGLSLQNQLSALFESLHVSYSAQQTTEGKNKPDFIFPGIEQYQDELYDPSKLTMLAAKSSCKERWRQILTEAEKIEEKHLCTLDQAISNAQMKEMKTQNVALVIPSPLQDIYRNQSHDIYSLADFISLVKARENGVIGS